MIDSEGSFVRWQSRRIEQFGVVTNLLLGLATGVLALEMPIAFGEKPPSGAQGAVVGTSVALLFGSVAVGLIVAWNRLKSFRLTAQIARRREQARAGQDRGSRRPSRQGNRAR